MCVRVCGAWRLLVSVVDWSAQSLPRFPHEVIAASDPERCSDTNPSDNIDLCVHVFVCMCVGTGNPDMSVL